MNAGIEFLGWLIFFALILVALALVTLGEWLRGSKPDVLPAPRMDCIAKGGKDHWLVSDVKTKP